MLRRFHTTTPIYYFISLFLLLSATYSRNSSLYAQFSDSFSDGNFTSNPTWFGDINKFVVNGNSMLQQNAPPFADGVTGDTAYLVTLSRVLENASWEFYVKLDFTPSTSNFTRIYLTSNQSNLKNPLNGYYVLVGQVGTSREISLYRQSGSTSTKIISGIPNQFPNSNYSSSNPLQARVKVNRDQSGNWELSYDSLGGNQFLSMGTAFDNTHNVSYFFGIRNRFSSTRRDLFFFDDFTVSGTPSTDLNPAQILSSSLVNPSELQIVFNKPLTQLSAETLSNYLFSGGLSAQSAQISAFDASTILIQLTNPVTPSVLYTLQLNNLQDITGNLIPSTQVSFAWFQPGPGDLVFNEVFPDPTPPIGLPEFEYIELVNNTLFPINLQGWEYKAGNSVRVLPSINIAPNGILVLADPGAQGLFPAGINVSYLSSWPSLTNGGATLTLSTPEGLLIDQMTYSLASYGDPSKEGGGWSLERVNPMDKCGGTLSWRASNAAEGGTPGAPNSIFNPVIADAKLIDVVAENSANILLTFNKDLDASSIFANRFSISPNSVNIQQATLIAPHQVRLIVSPNLVDETTYTLTVSDTLRDCAGSSILPGIFGITSYFIPKPLAILINEFMPKETPVVGLPANEWIELYNPNPFPISLRGWSLQVGSSVRVLEGGTVPADSFLVLMRNNHVGSFPSIASYGLPSWTALANSGSTLTLRAGNGMLIHSVTYSDRWFPSAKKEGGWSLELIDKQNPCNGGKSYSASVSILGGTPGFRNSVNRSNADTIKPRMMRAGLTGNDTLIAWFDKSLSPESVSNMKFELNNGLAPLDYRLEDPNWNVVLLKLPFQVAPNEPYWLTLTGDVKDCAGNNVPEDTIYFGIPIAAEKGDLVINEILSAATGANVDFVELYNASNKIINLAGIRLGNYDSLTQEILSPRIINDRSLLIMPGQYITLSTNRDTLLSFYKCPDPRAFWNLSAFPSLAKESGSVSISNIALQILDAVNYNKKFQFSLLRSIDNVSMERILFDGASQNPQNWNSASAQSGYATPGYRNSQFAKLPPMDSFFTLEPEIFSPDNDGYNDNLIVRYQLEESGWLGTVQIMDIAGRAIKTLANNEYLGTSGEWIWDGVMTDGSKARVGVYLVTFNLVSPSGRTQMFRKTLTLATRF